MKDNEYKCVCCGGVFEKGGSDEEADAEAQELWGGTKNEIDMGPTCDVCFNEFMGWFKRNVEG